MKNRHALPVMLPLPLLLTVAAPCRAAAPPAPATPSPNPERNAYFGDLHLHTGFSTDAFMLSVRTTPDDSYRFAMGREVEYMGRKVRRKAPLDFLAVTDHAEYLGVFRQTIDPAGPFAGTEWNRLMTSGDPADSVKAYQKLLSASGKNEKIPDFDKPQLMRSAWDEYVSYADKYDQPGVFTAFVAFEWTSAPQNQNLHRCVIFRGKGPQTPFTSRDSDDPERLWDWLETQRAGGLRVLAIPHNGNASNGLMFNDRETLTGQPITRDYAQRRQRNEPLTEIIQGKGQSETHPLLSPNDEFADFERFEYLIGVPRKAQFMTGSYVRQAYGTGMALEQALGVNPFKLGLVAGTDYHSGISSTEEFNYVGSHGNQDSDPKAVIAATESVGGEPPTTLAAAGLTGVWAEENTRASLWDALARKEAFGTSGVRIRVRFFGSWSFPADLVKRRDWVKQAYASGVPMGRDLPRVAAGRRPTFVVHALKDPDSGNLDRLQVVKVWTKAGASQEKVVDVAWSGGRRRDPNTGKVPPVGSTVDLATATYTNTLGAAELVGTWTDDEFDPDASATYYARVLEIPTPRWSTIWAVREGVRPTPLKPTLVQERAWTSPIWYVGRGVPSPPAGR